MAYLSLIPPADETSLSFQVLDETARGPTECRQHVHVPPELLGVFRQEDLSKKSIGN